MASRVRLITGLAGFLLVVGVAAVAGVRVAATPDLMTVAWWSDGVLHVGSHTVRTARPENLEMVRHGVVLWAPPPTRDGPSGIVWVDDSGDRRTIGSKSWPSPLAADPRGDTVAWVEATRTTRPQLIIYDTAELAVIAQRPLMKRGPRWRALDAGSFPISIDGDRVYYAAQDGDYGWDFRSDNPPRRLDTPAYLQAREAGVSITTRPYPEPDEIAANGSAAALPDGSMWQISSDGRLAGAISNDFDIALWDVVAQRRLEPGPLAHRPAVDLSFDGEGRIVVAWGTEIDPAEHCLGFGVCPLAYGPPFDVAVCSVKPVACTTVAGSKARIGPVLGR